MFIRQRRRMWLVPGCAPVTADSVLRLTLRISLPQQGVDVKFRVKDRTPMLLHVWGDPLWSSPSPYLRTKLSLAAGTSECTPGPQIAKPCSILHCLQCSTSFLAFFFSFFFCSILLLCVSRKPCWWTVASAAVICDLEAEKAPEELWFVSWMLDNVL